MMLKYVRIFAVASAVCAGQTIALGQDAKNDTPVVRISPEFQVPAFDPPAELPAGPEVLGDRAAWIARNDYPARAKRAGDEGRTAIELTINKFGRVVDCIVTESSGSSELDTATCRNVRSRARFRPAFDAKGEAIASKYETAVRWKLDARPTPEAFGAAFSFTVAEDGTVEDCEVSGMIGAVPKALLAQNPCTRNAKYEPFLDANGNPVRRRVTQSYSTDVMEIPDMD